jgi:hypothetical protein
VLEGGRRWRVPGGRAGGCACTISAPACR